MGDPKIGLYKHVVEVALKQPTQKIIFRVLFSIQNFLYAINLICLTERVQYLVLSIAIH